jgi:hypothetical protein
MKGKSEEREGGNRREEDEGKDSNPHPFVSGGDYSGGGNKGR